MIISQNISVSCTTHSTGHSTSIVVDGDTSDTVTMGADGSYIAVRSISDNRDSITLMFQVTPALRRMLRLMDMELSDEQEPDESDSADAAERVTQ